MLSLNAGIRSGALATSHMDRVSARVSESIVNIATGSRLTSTSVDASTKSLAEQFRSMVVDQRQVALNVSRATSLMETANSAMTSVMEMLERIKVLTTSAANGAIASDARSGMQKELDVLLQQIQQTAESARFGDLTLLNGQQETGDGIKRFVMSMSLGADNQSGKSETFLTIPNVGVDALLADQPVDITSTESAKRSQAVVDKALKVVASAKAEVGAQISVLDVQLERARSLMLYGTEARSQLADTDIPAESIALAIAKLQQNISISVLAQLNDLQEDSLRLVDEEA